MHRGKTALIVSSPPEDSPLWKAEHVDNYPGLPGVTGRELLQKPAAARGGLRRPDHARAGTEHHAHGHELRRLGGLGLRAGARGGHRVGPLAGEAVSRRGRVPRRGRELLRHLRRHALPRQKGRGHRALGGRAGGGGVPALHRLRGGVFRRRAGEEVRDKGRRARGKARGGRQGISTSAACSSCARA